MRNRQAHTSLLLLSRVLHKKDMDDSVPRLYKLAKERVIERKLTSGYIVRKISEHPDSDLLIVLWKYYVGP